MASKSSIGVGIGVFVYKSSKANVYLLGKRLGSHGAGTYALPGGHLELGETFEECAAREVLEETGLVVKDLTFVTAVNSVFLSQSDGVMKSQAIDKHYVTILMRCVVDPDANEECGLEPRNMEPQKCEGWTWTSMADMMEMERTKETDLFLPLKVLLKHRPDVCRQLLSCSE